MAKETIKISENVLSWIYDKYADKLGTAYKNFLLWLNGEKEPTVKQAIDLFNKLNLPIRYMFLNNPPKEELKLVEFRTIDSQELINNPSRELMDVYNNMLEIKDWMVDYLKSNELEPLSFVGCCNGIIDKHAITNRIMQEMNLSFNDLNQMIDARNLFNFIRKRCEQIGIIVMMNGIIGSNTHRKLNIKEFRAFALVDKYAPLIFINSADSFNARLFSLLHEIVHIFIGANDLYNLQEYNSFGVSKMEILCNAVAAEILIPDQYIKNEFEKIKNSNKDKYSVISGLKAIFKGSEYVIIRKLLDNRLITKSDYDELISNYKQKYIEQLNNKKSARGGNYNVTLKTRIDSRLAIALNSSAENGAISYVDVYRMTYTNSSTFDKLIKNIRGDY